MEKKCSKCHETKQIEAFGKQKAGDGYRAKCKKCCNEVRKSHYKNVPEARESKINHAKNYYKENKTLINERKKELRKHLTVEQKRRNREQRKPWAKKIKQFQIKVKLTNGCQNPTCAWKGDIEACMLQFHHRSQKTFNLGHHHSIPRMLQEMSTCTVLCSNCHNLVTWNKLDDSTFPYCNTDF